jgi:8-oxo-dGTP pyrophosphatase MutT (NUDIX family)
MPPPEPPPPPEFPQRLARRVLYTCPWLTLYQDEVRLPDGRLLPEYHVVQFQDGVGVLVENDLGELLFEHTYRYATQRLEWAIPAGGIDAGEDPLSAARREVYEETGIETSAHRLLYSYHPNNGASSQTFFLAHCKAGAQTGAHGPRRDQSLPLDGACRSHEYGEQRRDDGWAVADRHPAVAIGAYFRFHTHATSNPNRRLTE